MTVAACPPTRTEGGHGSRWSAEAFRASPPVAVPSPPSPASSRLHSGCWLGSEGGNRPLPRGLELRQLQKGSDEFAKLQEELSLPGVRQAANKLDMLTDVPMGDAFAIAHLRHLYETLSDVLEDAYFVLANVNQRKE